MSSSPPAEDRRAAAAPSVPGAPESPTQGLRGDSDPRGILESSSRLVREFGASPIGEIPDLPDCPAFDRGLVLSHRDFDEFLRALRRGESCAVVSGFNASGTLHLGHRAVLDISLYFQRKFRLPVFLPLSDDESYVTGKVASTGSAHENAIRLAREVLAYGFDPARTHILIDHVYTNIYNLAMELSRRLTVSTIRATYGYSMEDNPGVFFYPAVQAAHVLLPMAVLGYDRVMVPIGPDEDPHLRICRDVAARQGLRKPAVLHVRFQPDTDGVKMSKSRGNTIGLFDSEATIRRKVGGALSGGAVSVAEHRKLGGDPSRDVAYYCLEKYFLEPSEASRLAEEYRRGEVLSGTLKNDLADRLVQESRHRLLSLRKVTDRVLARALLQNSQAPYPRANLPSKGVPILETEPFPGAGRTGFGPASEGSPGPGRTA